MWRLRCYPKRPIVDSVNTVLEEELHNLRVVKSSGRQKRTFAIRRLSVYLCSSGRAAGHLRQAGGAFEDRRAGPRLCG